MGKALLFYTGSNTAVSGNSMVDLLVTAFYPNVGHFLLKSHCDDLVLVDKVKNGSQLLVVS